MEMVSTHTEMAATGMMIIDGAAVNSMMIILILLMSAVLANSEIDLNSKAHFLQESELKECELLFSMITFVQ